jgi:microcystin degradation protein MlrC
MGLKIAVGSLIHEGNSFSPTPTTIETFESYYIHRGDAILDGFGTDKSEVPGFLNILTEAGATPMPLVATFGGIGGAITRDAFDAIVSEMEWRLKQASPVDGVLLSLHGAVYVEDEDDGDGEIIERLRMALSADIPIGVTLDLHGHITQRMLQPNTFLIGYETYPHIDLFKTGQKAARLMLDTISGKRHPVMALAKRPFIASPTAARTTDAPLTHVVAAARKAEREGRVLHASYFPVQPWLDVPDLGFAVLTCADGNAVDAVTVADELCDLAWGLRKEFEPNVVGLDEAIQIGLSTPGVTVIGDAGDAPSAGSAADNATILKKLLEAGEDKLPRLTYLSLCDPAAVEAACEAGVGSMLTTKVGHFFSKGDGDPVTITGKVRLISDGDYHARDNDVSFPMGQTAVIEIGSIRLLVRTNPAAEWDVAFYISQGLDPEDAGLVFVKSPGGFYHSFNRITDHILIADTPGPTMSICEVFHSRK